MNIFKHMKNKRRPFWQWLAYGVLAWFLCIPLSNAQIPPLPAMPRKGDNTPTRKKIQPSIAETPFSRKILAWGRTFRKTLPKGWEMQWTSSRLRALRWLANHQPGVGIRFARRKEKVVVPIPFPKFGVKGNSKVIPRRCSLHFYPREGHYAAHQNLIVRLPPAALIAVTKGAIVFQPNRFQAMEYPCPKLLKRFRKDRKVIAKALPWKQKLGPWRKHRWLKKATKSPYHLTLYIKYTSASEAHIKRHWKQLLQRVKRKTLVVYAQDDSNKQIKIYNIMKMKINPTIRRLPKGIPRQ